MGKAKMIAIGVTVLLITVTLITLPTTLPAVENLLESRWQWLRYEHVGSPEEAWAYYQNQIPEPKLKVEVEVRGSTANIQVISDKDCSVSVSLTGPIGTQTLTSSYPHRYRTSRELPDGRYKLNSSSKRCVRTEGKAATYKPVACAEAPNPESPVGLGILEFFVDTSPPTLISGQAVLVGETVEINGSTQDLSGLVTACLSRLCIATTDNSFRIVATPSEANRRLRYGQLEIRLTDTMGQDGTVEVPVTVNSGWAVVDEQGVIRSLGDKVGIYGPSSNWEIVRFEGEQPVEVEYNPPEWFWGIRILTFILVIVLLVGMLLFRPQITTRMAPLVSRLSGGRIDLSHLVEPAVPAEEPEIEPEEEPEEEEGLEEEDEEEEPEPEEDFDDAAA